MMTGPTADAGRPRPRPRVALITGAARGIGAATARRLASDGFSVVINYATSDAAAKQLVEDITEGGGTAMALRADVSDPGAAQELVERAAEPWGPVSVLVNNAGLNVTASVSRMEPQDWNRVIGANLSGAFYCTHAALPAMYEARHGRIVFVGSPAGGRIVAPGMAAYAAAKAGIAAASRVLAKEVSRRGITVNTVIPGYVDTEMTRAEGEETVAHMQRSWPAVPADAVADAISFLVSDRAAHISGEELGVWLGGPYGMGS